MMDDLEARIEELYDRAWEYEDMARSCLQQAAELEEELERQQKEDEE